MVKYFCDCCGREMDNSISHQLIFRAKNPKVVGESKNEVYSLFDDERKVCNDCFNALLEYMDNNHTEERPYSAEESTLNDSDEYTHLSLMKFLIGVIPCVHCIIMEKVITIWYDYILRFYDFICDKITSKKDCNTL